MQGDSYKVPIEVLAEDGVTDPTVFDDVEIVLWSLIKIMAKEQISYDTEKGAFISSVTKREYEYA